MPVSPKVVARARSGELSLLLTPTTPVPRAWLGDPEGKKILGLVSGGGQQGPRLAAAGAKVTTFDNSPEQLALDRACAAREGLALAIRSRGTWSISAARRRDLRHRLSSVLRSSSGIRLKIRSADRSPPGFRFVGLYEDGWSADPAPLHRLMKCYIATRAQNMKASPIGSADFRFVSFIAERR